MGQNCNFLFLLKPPSWKRHCHFLSQEGGIESSQSSSLEKKAKAIFLFITRKETLTNTFGIPPSVLLLESSSAMAGRKEEEATVGGAGEEEEEERLMEDVAVLDFDMLCATVAMQTQGLLVGKGGRVDGGGGEDEEGKFGGVQRMWEGGVLDCFDDRRIALETVCCPCYRFGKNMKRAGFGTCCLQGTIYVILVAIAMLNYVAFGVTRRHSFLYMAIAFTISVGVYLGLFRTQIRKQFNIRGSNSALDDCMQHIICPCCTLCQESRTLDINNVRDGVWQGRGDTICVGKHSERSKAFFELRQPTLMPNKSPELFIIEREPNSDAHAWNIDRSHSEPLVPPI